MLFRLEQFTGRLPKFSDRLLPPNGAVVSNNAEMYSGELRGLRDPLFLRSFDSDTLQAFRLDPDGAAITDTAGSEWVQFKDVSKTVHMFRGPVVGDTYDRYYWSGKNTPFRFNDRAAIEADIAVPGLGTAGAYKVGVPRPTAAPSVSPATYVSASDGEARSYVYTFVNVYGEESAPSDPSPAAVGHISTGTWALSGLQTSIPGSGYAALDKLRIYRTVTGQTVDFRFVAEVDPPATTYNDTTPSDDVALNEALATTGFDPPPADLDGVVALPNGMLAGFVGKDVYFSEPYLPHAWPATYILSLDTNVVGLGVHQSGLVACTTGNPYVFSGVAPLNMSMSKLDDTEPCQSRRSIVSTDLGVFYASQNGLVQVSERSVRVATAALMTRNEWRSEYAPASIFGVLIGDSYLGFTTDSRAFIFGNDTANGTLVDLTAVFSVASTAKDPFTGEVYLVRAGALYWWNPTTTSPLTYRWLSKVFEVPKPINLGAFRLLYRDVSDPTIEYVPSTDYSDYNTKRFAYPLCPLNAESLNRVHKYTLTPTPDPNPTQNQNGINGSPLRPSDSMIQAGAGAILKVYADCSDGNGMVLRYSATITDERQHRLPSGFKAMLWQFEIVSSNPIYSWLLAETGRELSKA